MPYRKRYNKKRYRRKRRYNKKRNVPSTKVIDITTGVPDKLMTKFKYTDSKILNDNVGGVGAIHVFSGNSLHDPDHTGIGGQPLGYDQWSAFYSKYMVYGAKIKCTFLSRSNLASTGNLCVTVVPQPSVPSVTYSPIDIIQHPYSKYKYLTQGDGSRGVSTITTYMSAKKMFGINQLDTTDHGAIVGGDPSDRWFYGIQAIAMDGTSTLSVQVLVEITYYACMYDRIPLANS